MHEDRFTELPEELARLIFSALPTPDFFALHRSSKKCRQLCLTKSFLKFGLLPYSVGRDRSEGCENELANYLDRFLAHRGRRKTQYFRLGYAMQNEVEELDLDFTLDDAKPCINFPHSLYTCESLTTNLNRNHFYWDFPSSIPFPNLQFLSLKLLKVNNGCLFGEWNPSWNTIKEIRFEQVDIIGGMKIKSSCLVRFEVLRSHIDKLRILGERLEVEVQWPKTLGNLSIS
ncbi:hypothetical protein OIU84_026978 [Salix udensis]|uniref:F-box domain-containing protein n=1 Tax=Salix udensis TaxID=889485 RepID=A0AAD6PB07_9ROSI|nr:hypothetical protein OIU84_026978 [Salix udensis]